MTEETVNPLDFELNGSIHPSIRYVSYNPKQSKLFIKILGYGVVEIPFYDIPEGLDKAFGDIMEFVATYGAEKSEMELMASSVSEAIVAGVALAKEEYVKSLEEKTDETA